MSQGQDADLGSDPDALREKYQQERDRRLRPNGNAQYREVAGEFRQFVEDPHSEPLTRRPLVDQVDVAAIGGGSVACWRAPWRILPADQRLAGGRKPRRAQPCLSADTAPEVTQPRRRMLGVGIRGGRGLTLG